MGLLINEAIKDFKKRTGKSISKRYLGRKLWPGVKDANVSQNMSRLVTGSEKTIRLEWLDILEHELGCTKCQLIGAEPFEKPEVDKAELHEFIET